MSRVQWAEGWDEERFIGVLRERNGFVRCTNGVICLYSDNPEDPAKGRTCAIGAFIPPECYDISMEAESDADYGSAAWATPQMLVNDNPEWFPIIDGNNVGPALESLQSSHDNELNNDPWSEDKARRWARTWVGEAV